MGVIAGIAVIARDWKTNAHRGDAEENQEGLTAYHADDRGSENAESPSLVKAAISMQH